jgi:hypothetical protein
MPTKDQPGHSNVDQLEARVKRAANVYNPKQPPQSVSSEHNPEHYPETNQFDNPDIMMEEMSNDLNSKSVVGTRQQQKKQQHTRMSIYQNKNMTEHKMKRQKRSKSPSLSSVVDQGTVERYQKLQELSLEYMHLIETEARKLLDMQKKVMEESLHLEHIRKEFGGYTTATSVLNSGERGSKEAIAKEKAFFEQHIQNLESELVAANKMVSKEIIKQDKIRLLVNEQRRLIVGKKKSLIQLNKEINSYRKKTTKCKSNALMIQEDIMEEKEKMIKMEKNEQTMMIKSTNDIEQVSLQKRTAAVQFKNNMTSMKQEVERQRRAVTMERLKTMPKRPHTSQGTRKKGRVSLRARVGKSEHERRQTRPRTAGGQLISRKKIANKAEVMKGSRKQKEKDISLESFSGALFQSKNDCSSNNTDDQDESADLMNSSSYTVSSPSNKKPLSLKPTYDDDPDAEHDITKHPKLWMPGRPQERFDPSADHNPESKYIPSPLGRRGALVGRNPGRFGGAATKLRGRLELLLSTLPEIDNKKQMMNKQNAAISWQLARKQMASEKVEESIEELEKLWKTIQRKTSIDNIEEFANVFMNSEARQFVIVKQIEDYETTLRTMQSNNHSMIKEIELEKRKLNEMKENSLFNKISLEINNVRTQEKNCKKLWLKNKNYMKLCTSNICSLLNVMNDKNFKNIIGNDNNYIEELLGVSSPSNSPSNSRPTSAVTINGSSMTSESSKNNLIHHVAESLLPQCLGAIEECILKLIQMNKMKNDNTNPNVSRRGSKSLNGGDSNNVSLSTTPFQRPPSNKYTSFGENSKDIAKHKIIGGNLPVEEQIRKKFKSSPQWMLNMAVEMRNDLGRSLTDDRSSSGGDSIDTNNNDPNDQNDQSKQNLEENQRNQNDDNNTNNSLRKSKRKRKEKLPSNQISKYGLSVLLPREEELETSSEEDDDERNELNEDKKIARPVSRAEMTTRALLVVQRRQEIHNFFGINSVKQREERR